jgi:hypothetical protein
MRINPPGRIILAALCCIAYWGCGPPGKGTAPSLIPVKGKVTYKGQPLTKGLIRFEPTDYGREASGDIHPDGTFVLSTHKDGDGVVAGHHRVAVNGTGIKSPKDAFAKKYGGTTSSGLTADVDTEHTEFTFDLK